MQTPAGWIVPDIPKRADFDPSVLGTQPIFRLARRCPPHRRRLRRHLGQLGVQCQPVDYAIKFQSLVQKALLSLRPRVIRSEQTLSRGGIAFVMVNFLTVNGVVYAARLSNVGAATMPPSNNFAISRSLIPTTSPRISSVCSPNCGALTASGVSQASNVMGDLGTR
jgi:hypothetical protein